MNFRLFYLFYCSNVSALNIGSSFGWPCVPLTYPHQCRGFFVLFCFVLFCLALSYFLALEAAPGSSCIFPGPVLESAISPRSPCSFYLRMVWETKIRALVVFVINKMNWGVVFALSFTPSSTPHPPVVKVSFSVSAVVTLVPSSILVSYMAWEF